MKRTLFVLALTLAAVGLVSAESDESKFKIGGGLGFLSFTNDQKLAAGGQSQDQRNTFGFWGASIFVDITQYFTISAGVWRGLGDEKIEESGDVLNGSATLTNNLTDFALGLAVKYPFAFGDTFVLSPKLGLSNVFYLSGDVGGNTPVTSDDKQFVSPLSVTFGVDADWALEDGWIFRIPLDLGIALNSRLSDAAYGGTYDSSSVVSFTAGLMVARKL